MTAPNPDDTLVFLPLGGCEEIGMNLNAYGYGPANARRWVIIDVGVTFGDGRLAGVDIIMPDPEFLVDKNIDAIILTHAHEDHIGALAHLYRRFKSKPPMYATAFTKEIIGLKFGEQGLPTDNLHEVTTETIIEAGPFTARYISLTHSIPEPNAIALETPLGTILHTGDWKIDSAPVLGKPWDPAPFADLGNKGVLAVVCDSTNVFVEGEAGSETTAREALVKLIGSIKSGRIAVATFASNVARLSSIIHAAEEAGRSVCLAGRSMERMAKAAQKTGILPKSVRFVDLKDAAHLPDESVLFLCTGSQGEARAALGRIARSDHYQIELSEGDHVIFSSRVIPGNEKAIYEMQNNLADLGVSVITPNMLEDTIHVSGHPCRDELRQMYALTKPEISVPVHGERRHTKEHARFALELGVPLAITPRNGDIVQLAPLGPKTIDNVPAGKLVAEGRQIVPLGAVGLKDRMRISEGGYLHVSVALEEATGRVLDGPVVVARGISDPDGSAADAVLEPLDDAAEEILGRLKRKALADDDAIERALVKGLIRAANQHLGLRPVIDVTILRI